MRTSDGMLEVRRAGWRLRRCRLQEAWQRLLAVPSRCACTAGGRRREAPQIPRIMESVKSEDHGVTERSICASVHGYVVHDRRDIRYEKVSSDWRTRGRRACIAERCLGAVGALRRHADLY